MGLLPCHPLVALGALSVQHMTSNLPCCDKYDGPSIVFKSTPADTEGMRARTVDDKEGQDEGEQLSGEEDECKDSNE